MLGKKLKKQEITACKADHLSYTSGISSKPLVGMTIGEQFDATVAQYGDADRVEKNITIHNFKENKQ